MPIPTIHTVPFVPETLPPYHMHTPKPFKWLNPSDSFDKIPTGYWQGERIELRQLFPLIGSIPLFVYYHLRFACCARLLVKGEDELDYCPRCVSNCGFVCLHCLGTKWTSDKGTLVHCEHCSYRRPGEKKGEYIMEDEPASVVQEINNWLARVAPMGIPMKPNPMELAIFDWDYRKVRELRAYRKDEKVQP